MLSRTDGEGWRDCSRTCVHRLAVPKPPRAGAKFCDACGSPLSARDSHAEYKQVTVLFADVVHSMDIAAAVGAERLREIMAELVERAARWWCSATAARSDKFTGDGIMAVFGAPDCTGGPRGPGLPGRRWTFRARRKRLAAEVEQPRRRRSAAAGRTELGRGDRRRDRFGALAVTPPSVSRSGWRSGWSPSRRLGGVMVSASTGAPRRRVRWSLASRELVASRVPTWPSLLNTGCWASAQNRHRRSLSRRGRSSVGR